MRVRKKHLPRGWRTLATVVFSVVCLLVPLTHSASLSAQQTEGGVPTVRVDSISVSGNFRLTPTTIIGALGIQPGTEVTYREIQRGIKALYATGQFEDVVIRAIGAADNPPIILSIQVEERRVVTLLTISGLEHANEGTVRDTTGLDTGQPYSPAKVIAAKEFIRAELADDGIPFARIEERIEPIADRPGEIHLYLEVEEGNRITIADLTVRGNDFLTESEIAGAMGTKPEGFWWFRNGKYENDR